MTGSQTAVLDRIVDGETAVLLLEEGEDVVDEVTVPVERLPEAGRNDGAVFTVEIVDDDIELLEYRPEETQSRRESAQGRFDRLSERLGEDT